MNKTITEKRNIILIGMPSAGKSTIGMKLAEILGMDFADTDALILEKAGKPLKSIVMEEGLEAFLALQEKTILGMSRENQVIATGGSVIYSSASMEHLKRGGTVIFLELTYEELEERITPDRRFARNDGQSFRDLYRERDPLYRKYADWIIPCSGKSVEEIAGEITGKLKEGY